MIVGALETCVYKVNKRPKIAATVFARFKDSASPVFVWRNTKHSTITMDEYSSLFTSGLRAVSSVFGRASAVNISSSAASSTSRAKGQLFPSNRHLQPPNPALALSPTRRKFAQPSPRRKHRSSFTNNVASPLAGIKTPVRAAEVAARMSSMLLSPPRGQNRSSQQLLPICNEMAGAPIKPKPVMRWVETIRLSMRIVINHYIL
jgi:hypothetical protein